jgi:hypothetical protein
MENQISVVVLGDSLLMDSVAGNLRDELSLSVIRVEGSCINNRECLKSIQPDLIVFEWDAPRPCSILALLREQPGVLLLGIDTNCSQVVQIIGGLHQVQSMKEFCRLAQNSLAEQINKKEVLEHIG